MPPGEVWPTDVRQSHAQMKVLAHNLLPRIMTYSHVSKMTLLNSGHHCWSQEVSGVSRRRLAAPVRGTGEQEWPNDHTGPHKTPVPFPATEPLPTKWPWCFFYTKILIFGIQILPSWSPSSSIWNQSVRFGIWTQPPHLPQHGSFFRGNKCCMN